MHSTILYRLDKRQTNHCKLIIIESKKNYTNFMYFWRHCPNTERVYLVIGTVTYADKVGLLINV